MMRAILTKLGARHLNCSYLIGAVVLVDKLRHYPYIAENVYYNGQRIGSVLSYAGGEEEIAVLPGPIEWLDDEHI